MAEEPTPSYFAAVEQARAAELKELRAALFGPPATDTDDDTGDDTDEPAEPKRQLQNYVPKEGRNPATTATGDEAVRAWVREVFTPLPPY